MAQSAPETFTETYSKKILLPLGQLVEETRKRADVPNHLLETKICTKLKSNSVIHAEPSELHFSGFELGKDYCKILKLINISSEVINIHILSTQTKYFQTTYSKKYRLVPGLSYTLKVQFCPDEWRYFYDCIQVHCKEEDNLVIPVHAYPVIDDLHIPPHISLPAVPLGERICHVIPLSCSCPVDFEFQVFVLQSHKAFSVDPLTGVIPANGKVDLTVVFSPYQYGTSQLTFQVVLSQFNSKPCVCTVSGGSSPRLAISHKEGGEGQGESADRGRHPPSPPKRPPTTTQVKLRSIRTPEKPKAVTEQRDAQLCLEKMPDLSTHTGVSKLLQKKMDKMSIKDLRDAMSQNKLTVLTRQMKAVFFKNKIQQDIQEERSNHLRWQVHLGKEPVTAKSRMQILEEREMAGDEYMASKRVGRSEGDCARGPLKLSVRRVVRNAGQIPQAPASLLNVGVDSGAPLEVRLKALRLFQQVARKVVIGCRMNSRLACLRRLTLSMKTQSTAERAEEESLGPLCAPGSVRPFSFPIFHPPHLAHELAPSALGVVPVTPIDVTIQAHAPFFSLKVPQHYKLMGYQPVCPFEAAANHMPPGLPRTLRTGAEDELLPAVLPPSAELDETAACQDAHGLTFTAPQALVDPSYSHPLRIFNPAPGLHAFKMTPRYLECDPEFHLCPLPRYTVRKSEVAGVHTPKTQKKFLDRTDVIPGVMTWKEFPSAALASFNHPTLTSYWVPRRCDPFSSELLPAEAPGPPLRGLPDHIRLDLLDGPCEGPAGISLTPEMVRAAFPMTESPPSKHTKKDSHQEDTREFRERQLEVSLRCQTNRLGSRVTARLHTLWAVAGASPSTAPSKK
ncbi:cilia- and flagella-associated protein 221 [Osmerus mordax]|uniref:cilia- and flagella-associated protein 221 n=1 Tax=Osmerus mordax TaxID=8014 RepID=UPI003510B640